MEKAFSDEKDKEIKAEEEKYSSTQKLHDAAIQYIKDNWSTLRDDLIAWNTEYGNSLNSDILQSWNACIAAVKLYGSYLAALNASGSGNEAMNIIDKMKANSAAWHTADAESRQELADENKTLAASLSSYGLNAHMGHTSNGETSGVWYLADGTKLYDYEPAATVAQLGQYDHSYSPVEMAASYVALAYQNGVGDGTIRDYVKKMWPNINTSELNSFLKSVYPGVEFPKFHTGGVVGSATQQQDEMFALLRRGEIVLTKAQQDTLYHFVDFATALQERLSAAMQHVRTVSLPGAASIANRWSAGGAAFGDLNAPITVNISHNGSMSDSDAKRYGDMVADTVLDRLVSSFEKRGVRNINRAMLKA